MTDLSIMGALSVPSTAPLRMSSREIAELVGLRHDNVKRTIETLSARGTIVHPQTEDEQSNDTLGRSRVTSVFMLDKRSSLIVVAQLSPEFTARIVDRWQELEQRVARPMSQLEMIAASAQHLLMLERQQQAIQATQQQTTAELAKLGAKVDEVAASSVWDHCPQNCESISKIRGRILKQYGLPAWVIDMVMRELPLSPKVHGMVRNRHEEAKGAHYEVWAVADVTRTFKRFVDGCQQETPQFASHPDIDRRFHIKSDLLVNKGGK